MRPEVWVDLRYGAVLLLRETLAEQSERNFRTVHGRDQ